MRYIKSFYKIFENVQLADKLYFNNNKLDKRVRDYFMELTSGNRYFKLLVDLYMHFGKFRDEEYDERDLKTVAYFYKFIENYDSKLFPVPGKLEDYGNDVADDDVHVLNLFSMLKERYNLIENWKKLPSLIQRNIRKEITNAVANITSVKHGNGVYVFKSYAEKLNRLNKYLVKIPANKKDILIKRAFSSDKTLNNGIDIIENYVRGVNFHTEEFTIQGLIANIADLNAKIIFNKDKVMCVKVMDVEALQRLGNTALWCFSMAGGEHYWDNYCLRDEEGIEFVYIIYNFNLDFDDGRFFMVYCDDGLFLSNNEHYEGVYDEEDSDSYLNSIGIGYNLLEKSYMEKNSYDMNYIKLFESFACAEKLKKFFHSKIDWKFISKLQYLITDAEDNGVVFEIGVHLKVVNNRKLPIIPNYIWSTRTNYWDYYSKDVTYQFIKSYKSDKNNLYYEVKVGKKEYYEKVKDRILQDKNIKIYFDRSDIGVLAFFKLDDVSN